MAVLHPNRPLTGNTVRQRELRRICGHRLYALLRFIVQFYDSPHERNKRYVK